MKSWLLIFSLNVNMADLAISVMTSTLQEEELLTAVGEEILCGPVTGEDRGREILGETFGRLMKAASSAAYFQ